MSKSMTSTALRYVHLSEADLLHPLERPTFESGLRAGDCTRPLCVCRWPIPTCDTRLPPTGKVVLSISVTLPVVLSISVTLPVGAREKPWLGTARASASFISWVRENPEVPPQPE